MNNRARDDFWQSPFRLIQPNLRKIDAKRLDVRKLVADIVDCGANAALINGGGIVAWYPTDNPSQHVNEYMTGDILGEFLREAQASGLKVLVRVDVSKSLPDMLERHPDWFKRDLAGNVMYHYEMPLTCPSGPYWEEYNFRVVGELLARYPGIDGLFYNFYCYLQCHCRRCREQFFQVTGYALPEKEDWTSPAWRAFVRYRYDRFADYTRRLNAFIRERSPGTILTADTHLTHDDPKYIRESAWYTPHIAENTGCITVEAFNFLTRPHPKWVYWAGEEVKLGNRFGQTCVILSHSEVMGSRRTAQPPAQIGYDLMQIAAYRGSPAVAFSGTFDQDDRKALPVIRETMRFLRDHEAEYRRMTPIAEVGLVYSQRSLDFYGQDDPVRRWLDHYRGAYEALTESHILFTVLHEGALVKEDLSRYACLFLPNVAILSDEEASAIDRYVAGGGHLITTYETGLYDCDGQPREQILSCIGRNVADRRQVPGSYFWIHDKSALPSFADTDLIALEGELLVTEPVPGFLSQTALTLIPPVKNNTPEFAYWERVGTEPGLIRHAYGKGSVSYLPWPVTRLYRDYGIPEYRTLLADLIRQAAGPLLLETDAPGSLEIAVGRRMDGGYLLHILNGTGKQGKPQTEVIPVTDIRIGLRGNWTRARSLVTSADLSLMPGAEPNTVLINVPKVHLYEVIVVE